MVGFEAANEAAEWKRGRELLFPMKNPPAGAPGANGKWQNEEYTCILFDMEYLRELAARP